MADNEIRAQQDVRKNLAQLVDKMYAEFSRSENVEYGHQDYKSAHIMDYSRANTEDAVAFSYSGRKFKLTCGGPHFRDTSESWDFAGLAAYDGNIRLNFEEHATYFGGYQIYGSIPYPMKVLSMKHLGEKKYSIVAQIASENVTYLADFEKRKVEKTGEKDEKVKGGGKDDK